MLGGADLQGAKLQGAKLYGVNLERAKLAGADQYFPIWAYLRLLQPEKIDRYPFYALRKTLQRSRDS